MSRRLARENCFKLMYEYEFLKLKNDYSLDLFLEDENLSAEDKEFITQEYNGLLEHDVDLNNIIEKYLKGYTLSRIYKIDLAILKIAIYELKFSNLNTPANIVINEAVELAKKYSTEKSYGFINGILASVVNGELNAE